MIDNYIENTIFKDVGLAIKTTSSPIVKFANSFVAKAGGILSAVKAAGDCPGLEASLAAGGAASTNLADDKVRVYTLFAAVSPTDGAITLSWRHSADFGLTDVIQFCEDVNLGNKDDDMKYKARVGFVIIKNETGSAFVPGTTALDTANLTVTYISALGVFGK